MEESQLRTSYIFFVLLVLLALSFSVQATVNAQASYITVYGQLTQFQCPVGAVSGPCTGFGLTTNGTTPGILQNPMLDFSQSIVPAPSQINVGELIVATGYYGQESQCSPAPVNGCPAFFVHIWGPYYGPSTLSTATSRWSSSNLPTIPLVGSLNLQTFLSYPNVYSVITIVLVILLGYLVICRNKIFRYMKKL